MSDSKALVLTDEITEDKWPEIYGVGKVNDYYEQARAEALSEVPDLSTLKGREAIASNAHKVSRSKTFVEKPGRAYLKYIKETKCAAIEKELREFVEKMDALRDEVRKPLTDWDAEQKRIKAEKEAAEAEADRVRLAEIAARELQEQVDRDHELAIYLYADYLREKEAAAKQAIIDAEIAAQKQKEREEQIAKKAAENARIAAEQAAAAEVERARREKTEAEAAALRQQQEAERAAAKAKADAEAAAKAAQERAEREKQAAIEAERQRVAAEAAAQAAEAERRKEDLENQKRINNEMLDDFMSLKLIEDAGVTEAQIKAVITVIAKGLVRNIKINY
jgi:colicin import membrane protein